MADLITQNNKISQKGLLFCVYAQVVAAKEASTLPHKGLVVFGFVPWFHAHRRVSWGCNKDIPRGHTGIHTPFKKVLSTPTTTTSNNNKTATLCQATPLRYLELDLHLPHDDPAHVHRVRASLWHMLRADLHHPAIVTVH